MISGHLRHKNILLLILAYHSIVATYVGDDSIVELGWSQVVGNNKA